eukprot:358426-Chlamydomonas_euryale.AAC.2
MDASRVARYARTLGLCRTVCILYEYAARRVQYVLYAQVKICGCRRWCCGFRNTALAPHGVDFTQWIGHLRNKCVPRRTNAFVSVFSGMDLLCTCAKKASQDRHKVDTIPWRWREDEEDQQVLPPSSRQGGGRAAWSGEAACAGQGSSGSCQGGTLDSNLEDF